MGLSRAWAAAPAWSPATRQPDLSRLLDALARLRPSWALRLDADEDGGLAIEVLIYSKAITRATRSSEVREIKRLVFPWVDSNLRIFPSPEAWLRHEVAEATLRR